MVVFVQGTLKLLRVPIIPLPNGGQDPLPTISIKDLNMPD